uniref:Lymphocyte antigen 6E-like n=1 Tax=Serinus canaria TaxID=9135 RepID=A0A8C9L2H7_SERCA
MLTGIKQGSEFLPLVGFLFLNETRGAVAEESVAGLGTTSPASISLYSPQLQLASSLFCYICDNEHSNWNCMKTYKCEDHEKYCTTTYSTAGFGKDVGHRITKKCSVDCPETNVNFGMAAYSTKCCSTSLCNFSGANSIRINYAVVLLGILGSLICVLRVGL